MINSDLLFAAQLQSIEILVHVLRLRLPEIEALLCHRLERSLVHIARRQTARAHDFKCYPGDE